MSDEGRYEGETNAKGEPHGQGSYYYANGDRYKGHFKDDTLHGQGVFEWAVGARYEGQWKDNFLHLSLIHI